MAGLNNPYIRPASGGEEHWNSTVGRWEFRAALPRADERPAPFLKSAGVADEFVDRALEPTIGSDVSVMEYILNSGAGMHVTYARAFMTAAVWACMDAIAAPLASSDWNVMGGTRGADKKTALIDDQAQFLLNTRLNPEMTAQSGKRALMLSAAAGNGYAEIEWDRAGRFVALWPLDFQRVTPRRNQYGQLVYRCTQDSAGGFIDLDPVDVFHIRGPSLGGVEGDDAIGRAMRSIAQAIAVEEFSQTYFTNGGNLGGIVTMKGRMQDVDFNDFKKKWNAKHSGPKNQNKTAFLDGGATYTQLDSNAQKADLTNWKNQTVEEIARWWRVPPHKIGHLLRATNNNIEHQGLEFTRDTLRPWAIEIQQECDYKLFPARGAPRFVEIDLDWASQGDYGSRASAFQTLLNTGVFTVNTVLRKLGENTIGADGDKRLVQGAMVPLKDAGKLVNKPDSGVEPPQKTGGTSEPKPTEPSALLTRWLAQVYAKATRRLENRRSAKAPRPREDAEDYLRAELAELSEFVDVGLAHAGGCNALDGIDPAEAARKVLGLMEQQA